MTPPEANVTSLNARLKLLASSSLAPLLSAEGYVESPVASRHSACATQFHRIGSDHICLVDFQRSKYWTNKEGKFTINLGVYLPAVEAMRKREAIAGIPPDGSWTIATRLNTLAAGEDRWWTLTPRTKLEPLGEELQRTWRDFGSPWMEKNRILANARDWQLENGDKWPAVFSTIVLGERDRARRMLRDLLWDGSNRNSYLVEESQSLGLLSREHAERLTWAIMQDMTTLRRVIEETLGLEDDSNLRDNENAPDRRGGAD